MTMHPLHPIPPGLHKRSGRVFPFRTTTIWVQMLSGLFIIQAFLYLKPLVPSMVPGLGEKIWEWEEHPGERA
jgi:hypothetical protein